MSALPQVIGAASGRPATPALLDPFELPELTVFRSIPAHGYGIVPLRGMVAVYDTLAHSIEGIVDGGFYVREAQRPASAMQWESWLRAEVQAFQREPRSHRPHSPLAITREVVMAVRWPRSDKPEHDRAWRLDSGFTDGPYYDWAFGCDVVGKVVGIYLPGAPE